MDSSKLEKRKRNTAAQKKHYFYGGGKDYLKKWKKENYQTRMFKLFRDICPVCKERGRFRLVYYVSLVSEAVYYRRIQIDHWKYIDGKKAHLRTCYVCGLQEIMKYGIPTKEYLKEYLKDKQNNNINKEESA